MTSNSTGSDGAKRDNLKDAEACRRDAALMKLLGINLILAWGDLDLNAYHDDCFSIFNAVQIYVLLYMPYDINQDYLKDPASIYAEDKLRKIFQIIDVVKNYENLLGILLAPYPEPLGAPYVSDDTDQHVIATKAYRVCVFRPSSSYVDVC